MPTAAALMGVGLPDQLAKLLGLSIVTLAGVGTAQSGGKTVAANTALLTTSSGQTAFVLSTNWMVGDSVTLFNTSATTALIYPPSGSAIDGGSTDASIALVQNEGITLLRTTTTTWRSGRSALDISGNAVIGGTLAVTGASSLAALNVSGDVAVATNKFTVAAASGNTVVAGTLGVTGASSLAAVTATTVSGTGLFTSKSATAVPASAGAVAAGPAISAFSTNISVWVTSDTPAFSATKGDLCINTGGSSSSTRLYINNGTTTWVAVTTAS